MTSTSSSGEIMVPQEDVTCRLCKQPFVTPKLLTCLHSFCQLCIEERLTTEGGEHVFQCPLCKHQTRLQTKSASSLTTNFYVLGCQRVYACRTSKASGCVVCSMKGDFSDSTHHCLDCGDKLCETCSKGHNSSTLTATHRVVSLDEIRQGQYDKHLFKKEEQMCAKHCEGLNIFCHTCSEALCVQCAFAEHTKHQFDTVEEAAEKRRQSMKQALTMVVATSSNIQTSANKLQAEIDQLNKEEEIFVSDLTSSVEAVMEKIRKKSSEVLEKGRRSFEDERMKRQRMLELMNSESERREEIVRVCRQVEEGGGLTLLLLFQTLQQGLKEFAKAVNSVSWRGDLTTYKVKINLPLDTEFITFREVRMVDDVPGFHAGPELTPQSSKPELLNETTKMQATHSTSSSTQQDRTTVTTAKDEGNGEVVGAKDSSASTEFLEINLHEIDATAGGVLPYKRQFSTKVSTDKSQARISSMALKSEGRLLVLDESNAKLKDFHEDGKLIILVNQDGKCDLFKQFVCVDNDNICAIYENLLVILTKHLQVVSKTPLLPKGEMTCGPIVANFGKHILIGNLPNKEMRVMTTTGKVVRSWTSQVKGAMESFRYVADDIVIVCSWRGKGSVCLESEKGGPFLRINGHKRNGMKWRPSDAIFGANGRIIASDMHRNEILIFAPEGRALCVVDTMQNSVSEPRCVILDKGGKVYVSFKGGMVAVYKIA
ncbi:E3 ubiquitin-protein ligase TRIM56-like [Haliotis rufescens]|uniref:E3 ubiquitin-protein ligase TRIM56-like n=1 Tax=Haliotis rufescens TaxID=6454 RepID=UPI00201E9E4D|nr:E3 ubiquitin-protein ligase TRIM56-like [Haliotis rufescens]XP_046338562.2 E3 ubiquitin-protein ligase TRIM56-like [Haliotis rufescens]